MVTQKHIILVCIKNLCSTNIPPDIVNALNTHSFWRYLVQWIHLRPKFRWQLPLLQGNTCNCHVIQIVIFTREFTHRTRHMRTEDKEKHVNVILKFTLTQGSTSIIIGFPSFMAFFKSPAKQKVVGSTGQSYKVTRDINERDCSCLVQVKCQ
jgi:hypothetical protein